MLTNLSSVKEAREVMMQQDRAPFFELILPYLLDKDAVRRGSAASIVRNMSFDAPSHTYLMDASAQGADAVTYVLQALRNNVAFDGVDTDESNSTGAKAQLTANLYEPDPRGSDPDPAVRVMCVETLLLLGASRQGREAMRACGSYHVLKLVDAEERDEEVRGALLKACDMLLRREVAETTTADAAEKDGSDGDDNSVAHDDADADDDGQAADAVTGEEDEPVVPLGAGIERMSTRAQDVDTDDGAKLIHAAAP